MLVNTANYISGRVVLFIAALVIKIHKPFGVQFELLESFIREVVRYRSCVLPTVLQDAVILIEDRRYYQHYGIDLLSIARAIVNNLLKNRFEGASTIVQQLVRNFTEERDLTLKRKLKEALLSCLLCKKFSKEELLYAYCATYKFYLSIGFLELSRLENYDWDKLDRYSVSSLTARLKFPKLGRNNYCRYLKRVRTIEIRLEMRSSKLDRRSV
ncbi:MAG: biosynthetic peptidoglycan transglycosylase [Chitinophagales bacterium]|nr:biosynthetic peptidoglycan transglycosylase [Chitinophagales bacterium]